MIQLQRILLSNLLLLLATCTHPLQKQGVVMNVTAHKDETQSLQSITVEGMTVSWYFAEEFIHITATAPTRGWVAVGFNQRDDIVGANLVMGAVLSEEVKLEDHFVVRMGEHYPVEQLGGASAITDLHGVEEGAQTHLRFRLPIHAGDPYHFDLKSGASLYLIVAYSVDDDFAHHSRMRRHLWVTL